MLESINEQMMKNSSQMQERKVVTVVYKTFDLSIFKSLDGNRITNLQHVRRLSNSIKQNGMKCNPIIVNENLQVIDGQHRLLAAKEAKSFIYYIILKGYNLNDVHTLNLNQKNWTKKDFMYGYADMGIESYVSLKKFVDNNSDYSFTDCIAFCQNTSAGNSRMLAIQTKSGNKINEDTQIFEQGTWKCGDMSLAQEWANKIRMIKPYYNNYNKSSFVGTMIKLFSNDNFNYNEFMHKLNLQPTSLVDCANREQYKSLIEDIYNYRSRQKVSLKY